MVYSFQNGSFATVSSPSFFPAHREGRVKGRKQGEEKGKVASQNLGRDVPTDPAEFADGDQTVSDL